MSSTDKQQDSQQRMFGALGEGFPLGDRIIPWGVTLADLHRLGYEIPNSDEIRLPGGQYFGFDVKEVRVRYTYPRRPITALEYAIKLVPSEMRLEQARMAFDTLVSYLGNPWRGDRTINENPDSYSSFFYTHWILRTARVSMSASWYHKPHIGSSGGTGGAICVSWDDEKAIARPYHEEWQSRQRDLELITDANPIFCAKISGPVSGRVFETMAERKVSPEVDQARRVIQTPHLLRTPKGFCGIRGEHEMVLWQSNSKDCWGLSDVFNTIVHPSGASIKCSWHHVRPFHGPWAGEDLRIDSLAVNRDYCDDPHGNDDIVILIDELKKIANVDFEYKAYISD